MAAHGRRLFGGRAAPCQRPHRLDRGESGFSRARATPRPGRWVPHGELLPSANVGGQRRRSGSTPPKVGRECASAFRLADSWAFRRSMLRACAGRWSAGAPSVAVVDEFAGDEDGGGEAEGGVSVVVAAVGVAAELAVVRPPRVGGFHDPAEPEPYGPVAAGFFGAAALDVEVAEPERGEPFAYDGVVVAPVQVEGLDVEEEAGLGDVVEGGFEHADVVAVGAVDSPADGNPVRFGGDGPLPAQFRPVSGVRAGPFAAIGCFVQGPIDADVAQVEPDDPVERGGGFSLEGVE